MSNSIVIKEPVQNKDLDARKGDDFDDSQIVEDPKTHELLELILDEMRLTNMHLAQLSDENFTDTDIEK